MLGFGAGAAPAGRDAGCRPPSRARSRSRSRTRALPGLDLLVPRTQADADPDLVIVFDVAAESRLGALADRLRAGAGHGRAGPPRLEHRLRRGSTWSTPAAAATSVVAEELLDRLGVPLDAEIAECLYVALATDTGSFRFDMTTPRVHEMAARLIATGLRPGEISRRIFDSRPFGAMKLFADVLGRAQLDPAAAGGHGMVWTYATLDDLERHGQRPYVLDAPHRPGPLRGRGGRVRGGQAARRRASGRCRCAARARST